ncbi:3'-5' exonuclease [Chitinibacter sp. GC72]|uniref:3'-5' exonuclease n=1 Tax=Chitinibacter sp. GC72 TaxID=1526917 RepID=UPI0012FBAA7C|nr:3'-5' exonuclease [Chitinibacter sp. GC72]
MWDWLKLYKKPIHGLVQTFNQHATIPPQTPASQLKFLVIDIETTGFDAKKDHIVSIGWVPVIQLEIQLARAEHCLIQCPISVGQSAVFHGLHDRDLREARELASVMTELLEKYSSYVFVAHHSEIEQKFLQMACKKCFDSTAQLKFLDTMLIEWQRLHFRQLPINHKTLQLSACLNRHALPSGQQHNALADAYSCSLLLLSQIKQSCDQFITLDQLQKLSAKRL